MNMFTAWAIKNVAIVCVVGLTVWITKNPWTLLGLCFLTTISNKDDKKEEVDKGKE